MKAEEQGWTRELLLAAHEARPGNPELARLVSELGLGLTVDNEAALDQFVTQVSDLSVSDWRSRLARLERQICRIEFPPNTARGTGFLLGPDYIITAGSVLEPVLRGMFEPGQVVLRFDQVMAPDGQELRAGQTFRLERDWASAYETPDGLSLMLVRVAGQPGHSTVGESGVESYAETRGWINPFGGAESLEVGGPLAMLHATPSGGVKLGVDPNAIVAVSSDGTRFSHRLATDAIAAGAPCFDANLNLVGLHLGAAEGTVTPSEAVSFAAILRKLEAVGVLSNLGGTSAV
jgi:hypothetical protein